MGGRVAEISSDLGNILSSEHEKHLLAEKREGKKIIQKNIDDDQHFD